MMRSTLFAALLATVSFAAFAQTDADLKNDEKTPGDVPTRLLLALAYEANRRLDAAEDELKTAIVDLPSEVRVYDVTDATHPVLTASRLAEGAQSPVSIAASNGIGYVLGEKLYSYDAALNKVGEQLASYVNVPGAPVTFVDQRIRAAGKRVREDFMNYVWINDVLLAGARKLLGTP